MESSRLLVRNATICPVSGKNAVETIPHGAVLIEDDRIKWIGPERHLPLGQVDAEIDCEGRLVTPGLID